MEKGDRVCKVCGKYLGNYLTGDYYKLIRQKYCDDCRPIITNNQKLFSNKNNRKTRKLLVEELQEQLWLVKEENKALRELVLDIKDASGKALKQIIREEFCKLMKEILTEEK